MRALPMRLLFGAMFYWLWRIRRFAFSPLRPMITACSDPEPEA
jgi:hypothetical protein